jgi:hypothetical protein
MMDPAEETHGPEVYRVAVRLPLFWPERPVVWFGQAEAQFELAGIIRQRTKFNYVVSQLNQQQAAKVEDLIASPPDHEPYDRLKAELVRRLSTSREQRVRQLLSHEEMGDRKPSQFLRHLKALAPDVPDEFLRTIWPSRLPSQVQGILVGQTEGSLVSASQLADKICEVTNQSTTASISHATLDNTAELLGHIKELTRQIASLRTSYTRSRSQTRDCPRNTPDNYSTPSHLCWYHWKFGDHARRCTSPCSHQPKNSRKQRDFHQREDSHKQDARQ